MQKEQRFKIITEGLKNGISFTCRKYDVSRTIYYRWLNRYKSYGIDGLDDKKKNFTPQNKTKESVEQNIFNLIKIYPEYGPKAIKYLLEELGHTISESAIYNVMKRHNLSRKINRINFAKKGDQSIAQAIPSLDELRSGECWIFWITEFGNYSTIGQMYSYTFFDLKSRIACTRLYNKVTYENFEDLLTSVALSVATSLNLKINYLCFFEDRKILNHADTIAKTKINRTLQNHGYDVKIHFLKTNSDLSEINQLRINYVSECITFLMPLVNGGKSFEDIKFAFQDHIRMYNIRYEKEYDIGKFSPVDYHNKITNTKLILPIWAYMDRFY